MDLRTHYPKGLYALRNLSHVPRWSIVAIQQQQSVADHSYQATMLFKIFSRIERLTAEETLDGYDWMLTHDVDESLTSDVPSVVKDENWQKVEQRVHGEIDLARPELRSRFRMFDGKPIDPHVLHLCALADALEAFLKCFDESLSGNRFAVGPRNYTKGKVVELLGDSLMVPWGKTVEFVRGLFDECDELLNGQ